MSNEAPLSDDLLHLGQVYEVKKIPILINIKRKQSYCVTPQCVLIKTQYFPGSFMLELYCILLPSIDN